MNNTEPPPLLCLPDELLLQVLSHLDKINASRLALTCQRLRPLAESILWRSIHLTDKTIRPIIHPRQPWESSSFSRGATSPLFSISGGGNELFATFVSHLSTAPWRCTALRELDLDMRFEFPDDLPAALAMVAPHLEKLVLRTPGPAFHATYSLSATASLFQGLRGAFGSLHTLYVDVRYRWQETLVAITQAAPHLEVLHMSSHPRRVHGGPKVPTKCLQVALPRLRELVLDEMEEGFVPILAHLVRSTKRLENVALRDHAHHWHPPANDPFVLALSEAGLIKLECTAAVMPHLIASGFDELQVLGVTWGTDLLMASRKPDVLIPPLPNLREYQLDISSYTSRSQFDLHHTLLALPTLKQRAVAAPLKHFIACPALTTIHLADALDFFSRQDATFELPRQSYGAHTAACGRGARTASAFKGMIVVEYGDRKRGRSLMHVRKRVPPLDEVFGHGHGLGEGRESGEGDSRWDTGGSGEVGDDVGWEESATCEGVEVPLRVLSAVYAQAGIRLADVKPDRDATLPDEAWDVVDRWMMQREHW